MSIGSINFGPDVTTLPGDLWKIAPAITLRDEIAMRVFVAFAADALKKNWTLEGCAQDAWAWADELLKHRGGAK